VRSPEEEAEHEQGHDECPVRRHCVCRPCRPADAELRSRDPAGP
jgi:hypothetical protein